MRSTDLVDFEGSVPPGVLALRHQYEVWDIPQNQKKAVQRSRLCEMQGATIDGLEGTAYPRESKLCKYLSLAYALQCSPRATQKQWQVVCGGLVYFTQAPASRMLEQGLATHYQLLRGEWQRLDTPEDCELEVARLLGLLPLARLDFRLPMRPRVTCSDASTCGGGICCSSGSWSLKFGQCCLVLLGAGPPCQGVSGLNWGRKGALKDARSSLFSHVGRIRGMV